MNLVPSVSMSTKMAPEGIQAIYEKGVEAVILLVIIFQIGKAIS